jgi:hypothetical protein
MKTKVRLYRAEFYPTCPKGRIGAARFQRCYTVVGFWEHLVEAIERCHQDYWVEVFDAVTDKRLTEPFAPNAQVPDTLQQIQQITPKKAAHHL